MKHKSVDETPAPPTSIQKDHTENHFRKLKTSVSPTNMCIIEKVTVPSQLNPILSLTFNNNFYSEKRKHKSSDKRNMEFHLFPLLEECKSFFSKACWGSVEANIQKNKKRNGAFIKPKVLRAISVNGKQISKDFYPWPDYRTNDTSVMKRTFMEKPRKGPVMIRRLRDNISTSQIEELGRTKHSALAERIIYR